MNGRPTAAVLFLVHDNMDRLEHNFALVDEQIQSTFSEALYCVYENDSTDGSAEWVLDLAARRNDVRLLSETGYRPARADGGDSAWRYERMAACRNQCLDLARTHARHVDYAVVLDIDFVDFSQVRLAEAIGEADRLHPGWQALCGSGLSQRDLGVYGPIMRVILTRGDRPVRLYDVAAMQLEDGTQDVMSTAALAGSALDPPLRVISAFGGISVYKAASLFQQRYEGSDCEHLSVHRRMQEVYMSYKLCPLMGVQ